MLYKMRQMFIQYCRICDKSITSVKYLHLLLIQYAYKWVANLLILHESQSVCVGWWGNGNTIHRTLPCPGLHPQPVARGTEFWGQSQDTHPYTLQGIKELFIIDVCQICLKFFSSYCTNMHLRLSPYIYTAKNGYCRSVHCKIRLATFPSPAGMSLTKLSHWRGII